MKMRRLINGLLVLLLLSIASCTKEIPDGNPGEVAFKFEGTIGTPVLFEAGESNYIMHTDYIDNGSSDVLLMRGEFRDKTNIDDNYLRFEFYGYDSVDNSGIQQNVFNQTNYNSYSQDTIEQTTGSNILKFYTLYGTGATIDWDFGDGSTGSGDTAIHTYPSTINDATVTMTSFNSVASCTDSIANFINLSDPINKQVQFNVSAASIDSFLFDASAGFNTYSWDFGNASPQQGTSPLGYYAKYTDSLKKTIQLTAVIGSINSIWKAVLNPNVLAPCFAAYKYDVLSTPVTNTSQRVPFKSCVITYKRNGETYRSYKKDARNQSARRVFTLANASPYNQNADGQSTIRLQGAVNTFLYNINNPTDSIQINSSALTIAVAHP